MKERCCFHIVNRVSSRLILKSWMTGTNSDCNSLLNLSFILARPLTEVLLSGELLVRQHRQRNPNRLMLRMETPIRATVLATEMTHSVSYLTNFFLIQGETLYAHMIKSPVRIASGAWVNLQLERFE